jgi:hypothetical protein
MKLTQDPYVIRGGSCEVKIGEEITTSLSAGKGSRLYVIGLTSKSNHDYEPQVTLIGSPFPTRSWGRLFRASITFDPKRGQIAEIIRAFNSLRIRCRSIETIDGIKMPDKYVFSRNLISRYEKVQEDKRNVLSPFPSLMAILEFPYFSLEDNHGEMNLPLFDREMSELNDLIKRLLITGKEGDKLNALFNSILLKQIEDKYKDRFNVDWISPMRVLNSLHWVLSKLSESHVREKLSLFGAEFDSKLLMNFNPWRRIIWNTKDVEEKKDTRVVLTSCDSDERYIKWDFYDTRDKVISKVCSVLPGGVVDSICRGWHYNCISRYGGNVVASYSSPSVRDNNAMNTSIVVFPFRKGEERVSDARNLIMCFNELINGGGDIKKIIGDDLKNCVMDAFGKKEGEKYIKQMREVIENKTQRVDSVSILGPKIRFIEDDYIRKFSPNPYAFTMPIDFEQYDKMYGLSDHLEKSEYEKSRYAIALGIERRLRDGIKENFAIVGAHRSGKSTLLNLLIEIMMLKNLEYDAKGKNMLLVPIRIDSSITSPKDILIEIILSIDAMRSRMKMEENFAKSKIVAVYDKILMNYKTYVLEEIAIGANTDIKIEAVMRKSRSELIKSEKLSDQISYLRMIMNDETSINSIKISMNVLRRLVKIVEDDVESSDGLGVRFVVLIDELKEGLRLSDDSELPAWRHVLEGNEYSSIFWVISSTQSVREDSSYSPLSNVFREYNIAELSKYEANKLIDAMQNAPKENVSGVEIETKLTVVVSPSARDRIVWATQKLPFLIQVCCYHIYNTATRHRVPIVTIDMVNDVLKRFALYDLSDYFSARWAEICKGGDDNDTAKNIRNLVLKRIVIQYNKGLNIYSNEFNYDNHREDLTPQDIRILDRSGLRARGVGYPVAPLFLHWLVTKEFVKSTE